MWRKMLLACLGKHSEGNPSNGLFLSPHATINWDNLEVYFFIFLPYFHWKRTLKQETFNLFVEFSFHNEEYGSPIRGKVAIISKVQWLQPTFNVDVPHEKDFEKYYAMKSGDFYMCSSFWQF
jgi:hypothetical protein